MKNVFEHIEHVRTRPHHIRRKVAFSAAGGITALVGLIWLSASLGTGVFAIAGSSFADQTKQSALVTSGANDSNGGLAGAAAALPYTQASAPAHIEIIDTSTSTTVGKKAEQTTLPF
jgi:hypothetical protein